MITDTVYKFGDGEYVIFDNYERLRKALKTIYHYDDNEIWWDDRDDAADEMMVIAGIALGMIEN